MRLALLILCAPPGFWLAMQVDYWTQRQVNQTLTSFVGIPIAVGSLSASFFPFGLRFDNVRVGDMLRVPRVDVQVSLSRGLRRPQIVQVALHRPALAIRLEAETANRALTRLRTRNRASRLASQKKMRRGRTVMKSSSSQKSRSLRKTSPQHVESAQPVQILIYDGSIRVDSARAHNDSPASKTVFMANGVHLFRKNADNARLVIDRTVARAPSGIELSLGPFAADFSYPQMRIKRAASLGGSLFAKNYARNGLRLLRFQVSSAKSDGFRIFINATPYPKNETGQLRATAIVSTDAYRLEKVRIEYDDFPLNRLPVHTVGQLHIRSGQFTGTATLSRRSASAPKRALWQTDIDLQAEQLVIEHPWLSTHPIGPFSATIGGSAQVNAQKRHIASSFTLGLGNLVLSGRVSSQWPIRDLDWNIQLNPISCQQLLDSMPPGFANTLHGMRLSGQIGLESRVHYVSAPSSENSATFNLSPFSCAVTTDPPAADVHHIKNDLVATIAFGKRQRSIIAITPKNPNYRPLRKISPLIQSAFIAAEDSRFYRHNGFDVEQIEHAFLNNINVGRFERGASTISQQLVKNVFLTHHRTLSRKFQEAVLTWRLEQIVSKRRILEVYLNLVEMAPGVHGVQQASLLYFGKPAADINPLQAAHLAALTPGPRLFATHFKGGNPDSFWMQRLHLLLRLMRRQGAIDESAVDYWSAQPLVLRRSAPNMHRAVKVQ